MWSKKNKILPEEASFNVGMVFSNFPPWISKLKSLGKKDQFQMTNISFREQTQKSPCTCKAVLSAATVIGS